MEQKKTSEQNNKKVVLVVFLIVIAVIGYAIWQQAEKEKDHKGSNDKLKETYEDASSESQTSELQSDTTASDTKETEESSLIESETVHKETLPPETETPPETQSPPETHATPQPPAFDTSMLLDSWYSGCQVERTPEGNLFSITFDTNSVSYILQFNESNVKYDSGFWINYPAGFSEFEPFESITLYYRVEGDLIFFNDGNVDYVYRVTLDSYDLRLEYVNGSKLSTWDIMSFSRQ